MAEEGEVWSKLPHEVMESIFSRLSVYDIVRAGCACTRLRAFVSSHRLISSSSASLLLLVHPFDIASPHEVAQQDSSGWAYDLTRDAWLKLSLAFLQHNLPDFAYPVASDGGLLCFGSGRDFLICNPITRSCRRLPTLPLSAHMENGESFQVAFDEHSVQAFGLICNSITGTYEFFIIHHPISQSEKESRMIHYSSGLSQWRVMPPLVSSEPRKLHNNTITPCNSGIYTLWEMRKSLVVFAYCNGIWTEIESPDCTSTLQKAYLMDVHDTLHMVGGIGTVWLRDDVWERPTSIRIWKLHVGSMEWMEVTRMPFSVLQQFNRCIYFDELQCQGKNGVMYMKSSCSDVLMCDLGRNEWKWLKDSELDVDLEGFIFEASLSASA